MKIILRRRDISGLPLSLPRRASPHLHLYLFSLCSPLSCCPLLIFPASSPLRCSSPSSLSFLFSSISLLSLPHFLSPSLFTLSLSPSLCQSRWFLFDPFDFRVSSFIFVSSSFYITFLPSYFLILTSHTSYLLSLSIPLFTFLCPLRCLAYDLASPPSFLVVHLLLSPLSSLLFLRFPCLFFSLLLFVSLGFCLIHSISIFHLSYLRLFIFISLSFP